MLVQRLQKDILPKIESQIAELAKQDEPNEATKAISKQLKVARPLASQALAGSKLCLEANGVRAAFTCRQTACCMRYLGSNHAYTSCKCDFDDLSFIVRDAVL